MITILLPVDGSEHSARTVDQVIKSLGWYKDGAMVHLLNVQHSIPGGHRVAAAVGQDQLRQYHHDEGIKALAAARAKLDAAKVRHEYHISVGDPAELIARYATDKACDEIAIGARGAGAVEGLLLGSVVTKVIHLAKVPVLVVK